MIFSFLKEIECLTGVGSKLKNYLIKTCGGSRIIDILFHYPTKIIDRRTICSLRNSTIGELTTLIIKVKGIQLVKKKQTFCKILCTTNDNSLNLIFFNYPYNVLKEQFKVEEQYIICGKLEKFNTIFHPQKVGGVNDLANVCKIHNIYSLSKGLTQVAFTKLIKKALDQLEAPEWLPANLLRDLPSFKNALYQLHYPNNLEDIEIGRKRLALDELLAYQLCLYKQIKTANEVKPKGIEGHGILVKKTLNNFPYKLTEDQIKVIEEIKKDQASIFYMRRLLQGDVGSGKTIVALIALLNAIECGYQGAFMVPTSILAEQQFNWILEISKGEIKIGLLTGATKASTKRCLLENLKEGQIDLLVGTHAIFSEVVQFKQLGLVVIDEQHKFGVTQRLKLISKALCDVLLLSATPIPRTLMQVIYGNFKCSRIFIKPEDRLPIETRLICKDDLPKVISRLKSFIEEGNKVYWVCPAIDESDLHSITAANTRFNEFKTIFNSKVSVLHSKIPALEKEQTILDFKNNKIFILVTTTVIEIGINIPDANVIIIEDAERFGLAQLHQLRGRVGRSNIKSYCLLLYNSRFSTAFTRLKIIRESQNGFYIAEQDLKTRGEGELVGVKQAGLPQYIFADLSKDESLLKLANKAAEKIIKENNLEKFEVLLEAFKLWKKEFLY